MGGQCLCNMQRIEDRGLQAQGGGVGEAAGEEEVGGAEDEEVDEAHRVSYANADYCIVEPGALVTAVCTSLYHLGGRGSAVKAARDGNIQEFRGSKITFD